MIRVGRTSNRSLIVAFSSRKSACVRLTNTKAARVALPIDETTTCSAEPTSPSAPVTSVTYRGEKSKLMMAALSVAASSDDSSLADGSPMYKPQVWIMSAAGKKVFSPLPHAADQVSESGLQTCGDRRRVRNRS
jgi:hypothetical protein